MDRLKHRTVVDQNQGNKIWVLPKRWSTVDNKGLLGVP